MGITNRSCNLGNHGNGLDGENVVVPTRQGLSRFCLSDGTQNLRVNLPQLGWRNGVTVTNDSYLIGNEEVF